MNRYLCLSLLLVPSLAQAQIKTPSDSVLRAAAHSLIDKVPFCSLITIGAEGAAHARVVQQLPVESDFTVWVGTNPLSRKVGELANNRNATIFCEDVKGDYVSLIGTGTVVRDTIEKAKHWNPAWSQFYKNGYRGDDFVLIKVVPNTLEIVSYALGIFSERPDWRAATVQLRK